MPEFGFVILKSTGLVCLISNGKQPMKYARHDAKDYARENMGGIWAAALNPFNADLLVNEAGLHANIRHWIYYQDCGADYVVVQALMLNLTDTEKALIREAFDSCGLKV